MIFMNYEIKKLEREKQDIKYCLQLYGCELGELSRMQKYKRLAEIDDEIRKLKEGE